MPRQFLMQERVLGQTARILYLRERTGGWRMKAGNAKQSTFKTSGMYESDSRKPAVYCRQRCALLSRLETSRAFTCYAVSFEYVVIARVRPTGTHDLLIGKKERYSCITSELPSFPVVPGNIFFSGLRVPVNSLRQYLVHQANSASSTNALASVTSVVIFVQLACIDSRARHSGRFVVIRSAAFHLSA